MKRRPATDVVIIGMGWAGNTIAAELAKAGMDVVGLERGPDRQDSDPDYVRKHDELRFKVRQGTMQDAARETWTFRHDFRAPAHPMRYLGAFAPATGVGGSSGHYGGLTTRFAPWEFEMRSRVVERYGEDAIPPGATIADWGLTYDELAPYYDRFEAAVGVAGEAGNVNGELTGAGNPFEGPRSGPFPLPPVPYTEGVSMFGDACRALGHHPFPSPSAILSRDYTSPDGVSRKACTYCGDCGLHLCAVGAKGDSRDAVLPVAKRSENFTLLADAYAFRVLHETGRAKGVLFYDADGEVVEQPADAVVLSAYTFNNVRLLLLSELGRPYEPRSGEGVVGKNYAYQTVVGGFGFFKDKRFNSFASSNAGLIVDDFANDNFDHTGLGFIGGASLMATSSGGGVVHGPPTPPGTPRWGRGWQRAMREWFDRSMLVHASAHSLSYRDHFLDLDPTYVDAWGEPLLRITFDWRENEHRLAEFAAMRAKEIFLEMGADHHQIERPAPRFDTIPYQSTHNTGGAIMGPDPSSSVVNSFLQMWDAENVWVVGGSAFPQNGTPGPTGTIGALAHRAADGIIRYARSSGSLS